MDSVQVPLTRLPSECSLTSIEIHGSMKTNLLPLLLCMMLGTSLLHGETLSPHLSFSPGPVNAVMLKSEMEHLAIYSTGQMRGPEKPFMLLLTQARRDTSSGATRLPPGIPIAAPSAERQFLENPQAFWEHFATARFHDYDQQTTKIGAVPVPVTRWVQEGDVVEWPGVTLRVLDTPGYTRGGVSYLGEIDGRKVAFTGDLIHGDGQILDLYSFQDAIPEAKVRGYHGYGGRLGALVSSLLKVRAEAPDLIIPARGRVIHRPVQAIDTLIQRVRALYRNYLSTSALHWYFKEARMQACAQRVLGEGSPVELMPFSMHTQTPDWIKGFSTTRLILSEDGAAFMLDCGNQRVIDEVQALIESGLVKRVDGIFVTHYHDDHTDKVQEASERFDCPVYAVSEYKDVLEHPAGYHLPAMTDQAIKNVQGMDDGTTMSWHEFEFQFHFYPGQTYYHGALSVTKPGESPIFLVGDSFAPSGIDDYCVQNRNLVHEESGYLYCLRKLRDMPQDTWLINEHIPYVFRFSSAEMDYLESRYRERASLLSELFPWDDPNYGIDAQWAVFYPYGLTLSPGQRGHLEIRVTNHSPRERQFTLTPRGWNGLKVLGKGGELTIPARGTKAFAVEVQAPSSVGHCLLTADFVSGNMVFNDWTEALVTVE